MEDLKHFDGIPPFKIKYEEILSFLSIVGEFMMSIHHMMGVHYMMIVLSIKWQEVCDGVPSYDWHSSYIACP